MVDDLYYVHHTVFRTLNPFGRYMTPSLKFEL
jgi:hypothetical protein